MNRATKAWLIAAALLILIGCILFGGVMIMLKWDFTKLSTGKFETSTHEITESFRSIQVNTDTADIVLVPTQESCSVVCDEYEKVKHSVAVKDGTLVIEAIDTRAWYEHIGIEFKTPKITVYLPETAYDALVIKENTGNVEIPADFTFLSIDVSVSTGDVHCYASTENMLKIRTSTGNIGVEHVTVGSLELSVTTGKVSVTDVSCRGDATVNVSTGKAYLTDVVCRGLTSSGSTGDLSLKAVVASEMLSIKRTTGDIKLERCDASEIVLKTSTGDVTGDLLTDKIFVCTTNTGDIDVPNSSQGGRCEITTGTGDVRISVRQ